MQLKEVIAEGVRNRRITGFFFKSDFPSGWWRVMLSGGVELPQPLPQPSGCRADTQIACPGSNHRICNVQKCDGTEDCPKMSGEDRSWDEVDGCTPDTTTPATTMLTTTTMLMTTTMETSTTMGKEILLGHLCISEPYDGCLSLPSG